MKLIWPSMTAKIRVLFALLATCLLFSATSFAGAPIFTIQAKDTFPGTGKVLPEIVNTGEGLIGTYGITLSPSWPLKARVTLTQLPKGMTVNTTTGCGLQPVLSPGQTCNLTLNYKVPAVKADTLVQQGPFVCSAADLIHCSQPVQSSRLNMKIVLVI
jgi:hypothetical protein